MAHRDSRWDLAPWGAVEPSATEMPWGSSSEGSANPDVVNVYEVANLVGRGPTLSPAFATNTKKHHRP